MLLVLTYVAVIIMATHVVTIYFTVFNVFHVVTMVTAFQYLRQTSSHLTNSQVYQIDVTESNRRRLANFEWPPES
jgi:hypothetical protein